MDSQSIIITTSNDDAPAGTVFSTPEGHLIMTVPMEDIGDNRQSIINVPLIINADGSITAASNIQLDSVEANTISIKSNPLDKMKQQPMYPPGTQLVLVTDDSLGQRMILTTADGKIDGSFALQPQVSNQPVEVNALTNITFSAPNQQSVGTNFINTTSHIMPNIEGVHNDIQFITDIIAPAPAIDENRPPIAGPHKCKVCHVEFSQWSQKRRHELKHLMDKPFQCKNCSMAFNYQQNLQLHEVIHLEGPIWSCPLCDRTFRRLAGYKAHIFIHEKEESVTCEECGDEFSTQKYLDLHMDEKHNSLDQSDEVVISYECTICKKIFNSCSDFKAHMKDHTKLQQSLKVSQPRKPVSSRRLGIHKCSMCDRRFPKPSLLKRHWLTHSGERPFKCDQCGRGFSQKGSLLLHMHLHKGEKPFKCTFCIASFSQKGNLRSHISRTHAIERSGEYLYQCRLCPCRFRKIGSLNTHVTKIHSTSEVQKPKEDSKNGNADSDILQQAIAQSGLENAPGPKADPSTSSEIQVFADCMQDGTTKHYQIKVRRHAGFRWHQCTHCVKEFKKPSDLIRHLRTHTNEKPFKCDFCQRGFTVKSTLNVHLHTHLPQRPTECTICNKKYSSATSLAAHLKSHMNTKTMKCNYCEKTYTVVGNKDTHQCEEHKRQLLERKQNKILESKLLEEKLKESLQYLHDPLFASEKGLVAINKRKGSASNRPEDYAQRPHVCARCNCRFKKRSHLKAHEASHDGIKRFLCDDCGKSFTSKPALKHHIIVTHTKAGTNYQCNKCSQSYTTKGSLQRHLLCHAPQKSYFCPYCERQFSYSSACRQHIKTHAKEVIVNSERSKHNLKAAVLVSKGDPSAQTQNVVELVNAVEQRSLSVINPPSNSFSQPVLTKYAVQVQENVPPEKITITDTLTSKAVAEAIPQLINANVANISGDLQLNLIAKQNTLHGIQRSIEEYSILGDQSGVAGNQGLVPVESGVFIQGFDGQPLDATFFTGGIPIQTDPIEMGALTKMLASTSAPENAQEDLAQYSCDICKKIFMDNDSYKVHYIEEHSFPCQYCEEKFETEKSLKTHIASLHEKQAPPAKGYKCKNCNAVFRNPKQLQGHMNKMHNRSILKNSVQFVAPPVETEKAANEESSLLSKKDYNAIRLTEEEAKSMAKSLAGCPKTAVSENAFLQSLKEISTKSDELNDDQDNASIRYANGCHLCSKSFKKPSDLTRHLRTHTGEKPFICNQCGKAFAVRSTLVAHCLIHKKSAAPGLPCHICQAKFSTKGSLRVHMRIHTGARPLKCPHCSLSFRTSGHRKAHILSAHKALKKSLPEVEIVSAALPPIQEEPEPEGVMEVEEAVSALNTDQDQTDSQINIPISMESSEFLHIDENLIQQVHSGNFILYPSDADGFIRFEVFSDLSSQQLIGEIGGTSLETAQAKPPEADGKICLVCGKSFNKPSQLVRHARIHSGEKPFSCNLCEKRFNQKNALNAHVLTHTGVRKHRCELCGKFFTQAGNLKTHKKRTHKNESAI